jgi:1-acyl-sn-glycerol-3-phosphate acyltransferase
MMTFKLIRFLLRLILRVIARVEIVGNIQMPPQGGYVIASNHIGRLDAALVYYVLDSDNIIILVAEKYEKYAFTRWLTRAVNGIFINRFAPDVHALRAAMKRLQAGGVLAIAPEGTRSKSGALLEARPGGIYLAWKAGVPILPVALTGCEDAVVVERLKHFRRLEIKITAGKPFTLPTDISGRDRDDVMREYTDEVMCRIAALLPEEKRGAYRHHPRLKQIEAEFAQATTPES